MTAKLNARANKATGSQRERRGQDRQRKTCRETLAWIPGLTHRKSVAG